jgi:hypothetical protein
MKDGFEAASVVTVAISSAQACRGLSQICKSRLDWDQILFYKISILRVVLDPAQQSYATIPMVVEVRIFFRSSQISLIRGSGAASARIRPQLHPSRAWPRLLVSLEAQSSRLNVSSALSMSIEQHADIRIAYSDSDEVVAYNNM